MELPSAFGHCHPAGHTVHVLDPSNAYSPGLHAFCVAAFVDGHAEPAGQEVHSCAEPVE